MRYYFDFWENGAFSEDAEGLDCPDEEAALAGAKEAAAEIARDVMPREDGALAAAVTLLMQVSKQVPPG
jgi:hypothetical protein